MSEPQKLTKGAPPCALCGGPYDFDTSLPSVVWNGVIRARGLPDYLCTTCIVREFARAGQSFTAQLWNEEFHGVNIEVVVEGQSAKDASLISDENTTLRARWTAALELVRKKAENLARTQTAAEQNAREIATLRELEREMEQQ